MKWIIEEAKKIHTLKNIVILENPETRQLLDNLLLKKFYPAINKHLHETGYRELDNPKIETKLVYELVRSILFMMTDDFGYTFFRGEFECAPTEGRALHSTEENHSQTITKEGQGSYEGAEKDTAQPCT